jgi:hypothetical protein
VDDQKEEDALFAAGGQIMCDYLVAAVLAAWCGGDDCQLWARAAGAAIGGVPLWHATLEMRRQGCAARVCRARGRVQPLKTNPHVSPSIETLDRLHYSPRPRTRLDPR